MKKTKAHISVIILALVVTLAVFLGGSGIADYDYAKPTKWILNDNIVDASLEFITEAKDEVTEITSYLSQTCYNKYDSAELYLDENDNLINKSGIDMGIMETNIKQLLLKYKDNSLIITVSENGIGYDLHSYGTQGCAFIYVTDMDIPDDWIDGYLSYKIADHWMYFFSPLGA